MTTAAKPRAIRLRSTPAYGFDDAAGAGVDRANGILRGVSAIQAGPAAGHGVIVDATTLQQTADAINAAPGGIKVRFTHPGMCEDGLGKLLGKGSNARVAGDKVAFDLKLSAAAKTSPNGNLYQHVLDLATESPADVGFSIACDANFAWKMADGSEQPVEYDDDGMLPAPAGALDGPPRFRLDRLRAVDLVDEPAANRDGMFSGTGSELGAEAFAEIDRLLAQRGITTERAHGFAARYFAARGITPPPPESRPTPKGTSMDKSALKALTAKHPDHARLISDMFADDKGEAEILAAISTAETTNLRARHDEIVARLAKTESDHAAALAAKDAKLAELQAKHDALAKISAGAPKDPGGNPESARTEEPTSEAALKQEWDRDASLRQNFMHDFSVFVAFRRDAPPTTREKATKTTAASAAKGE